MSGTIVRRDFLKCALASAAVIPALSGADARATGLTPLDPTDSTAQSLGFVPNASKVAANASPTFKTGQHWAKRLRAYIEDKLHSTIRATDLAGVVGLGTGYFCRAFRKTFGESPVAYVMKRRMVRAQELMLKSQVPLSQVALECGMFDQAHFSRTFRLIVGTNPTAWRRQFLLVLR